MTADFRWGIAATGGIARGFVQDVDMLDDAEVLAVGSRTLARAEEFADEHGIPRRYGSYEELADDPEVDVVYVASPHARHAADTLLFLEAGKHVLCEKPFALNASEAETMIAAARVIGTCSSWRRCGRDSCPRTRRSLSSSTRVASVNR